MTNDIRSEDPAPYYIPDKLHRYKLKKNISGGQTGVDRGALDAALKCQFPTGGCCPKGRKAEDGKIPDCYPLDELPSGDYRKRTRQNVIDSDGTLIIYFGRLSGSTELTLIYCSREKKPYLLIDAEDLELDKASRKTLSFLKSENIKTLNVAGPRGSNHHLAYSYTKALITLILNKIRLSGEKS